MPAEKNQRSFGGGEISPALYAHTNLAKYDVGLRTLFNRFIKVQGGAPNRAGFEYLNCLKDHTKRPRLLPFQFGVLQNYILEFTDGLMRVYRNQGLVLEPADTITGITQANPGVVTTSAAHGYTNGQWVFIDSVVGMTEVNNTFFRVANVTATTYELQDLDGNNIDTTGYTAYTSGGNSSRIFELTVPYTEDILREITYAQSRDIMTLAHTDHQQAELSRTQHYEWSLDNIVFEPQIDPPTDIRFDHNTFGSGTFRYKVTAVLGGEESLIGSYRVANVTGVTNANPAVVTAPNHGFQDRNLVTFADVVGMTELNGKEYILANVTTNTFELTNIDSTSFGTYTSGGTATASGQKSANLVSNTDWVDITWDAVAGATSYNVYKEQNGLYGYIGTVVEGDKTFRDDNIGPDLTNTPPEPRDPFESGEFPGAVTYHKQRRVFAGPDDQPQTVLGSQVGNYSNMNVSSPPKDSDAYTFDLDSEQVQQVRHLTSLKQLIAFTSGSIWLLRGSSTIESITPTSIDADEEFVSGAAYVRPLRIGRDILYVEDGGKDVLFLNYTFEADGLDGQPLTLLSDHLFERREIVEWTYTSKPYGIIWCAMDDGTLLSMTYNRKQELWAWGRHETDGDVETVASIREDGEDYLYLGIKREINGTTKRYVERMHTRKFILTEDAFFVDSGLTVDARNTNTSSMMRVTGGTDWTTDETLTLEENGTTSPFTSDDVGGVFELRTKNEAGDITSRCQFTVTAYSSATSVSVTPNTIVPETLQATYTEHWARTFKTVTGFEHLEGKTVSILADGNVEPQQVVTNGSFALQFNASVVHAGLPYNADLETLDIDVPVNGDGSNTKRKGISEVTIFLEESRGLFVGPDADNLTEYLQRDDEDYNEPTKLLTGRAEIAITPTWTEGGRIYTRQSDPLPSTISAITPEVEFSD